jgi:hypothetical protein
VTPAAAAGAAGLKADLAASVLVIEIIESSADEEQAQRICQNLFNEISKEITKQFAATRRAGGSNARHLNPKPKELNHETT